MKKLALSLAVISALGLSACDSESIEDVKQQVSENGSKVEALARVVFDPGAAEPELSIPSDLLFSGSQDGTLAIPVADPLSASANRTNPACPLHSKGQAAERESRSSVPAAPFHPKHFE